MNIQYNIFLYVHVHLLFYLPIESSICRVMDYAELKKKKERL